MDTMDTKKSLSWASNNVAFVAFVLDAGARRPAERTTDE
jgi:hypothetical protein